MINHKSRIEKLRCVRSLFEYFDEFPQLEKEPDLQSRDKITQRKLSKILGRLEQLEPKLIGEDPPYHALFIIPSDYKKTEEIFSELGIKHNKNETYSWEYPRSFTQVRNYTGLENVSINILTEGRISSVRMIPEFISDSSMVEFLVIY